jgi:hypothetical protein
VRQISDRTLSEILRARLRTAGVFELFVRELAPSEWHASARGFADDGRMFVATACDKDVGRALLALLRSIDEERAAAPVDLPAPAPRREVARRIAAVRSPSRPHLERVALELAARLDGFTLQTFASSMGFAGDVAAYISRPETRGYLARLAATLGALVTAGELHQEGAVYRRPVQPTTGATT